MRVFIAGLIHETSSFSHVPTSRRSFEEFEYCRPSEGRANEQCKSLNGYRSFVAAAQSDNADLYCSTYAMAQPSGPCLQEDYESLRDEILDDLRGFGDADMVLLFLHGAQMAHGYDDCEGDLLTRAREIAGPSAFIGGLLDLHTNLTAEMLNAATILAACRFYPHTDFDERAVHLYELGKRHVQGEVVPTMQFHYIPMLSMFYTTEPKMTAVNEMALALQNQAGVLSVSLLHGFPWADMPTIGAGVLVARDQHVSGEDTDAEVNRIARAFYDAREETPSLRNGVKPTIDYVQASAIDTRRKPFVIADCCDNPGGGAGGDSTFILREVLSRGLDGFAFGLLWDPIAVNFAEAAGIGATFNLRLAGKTGPMAGDPLDVEVCVLDVVEGLNQFGIGYCAPLGKVAKLSVAGNIVLVNNIRGQVFSPSCFTDFGIEFENLRAVVVKSTQHFRDQFEPLCREVLYCDTPGSISLNNIDPANYRQMPSPMWPFDDIEALIGD